MSSIVGIHGVWNYHPNQSSAGLSDAWTAALQSGFADNSHRSLRVEVAYYSPDLRPPVTQGPLDPEALPPTVQQDIRSWLVALEAEPGSNVRPLIGQGRALAPVREGIERLARRVSAEPHLVRAFVSTFFSELALYLNSVRNEARLRVQATVRDFILERQPRVVIAHSLGSVVAWETLMENPTLPPIDLLLTLGSPLALPGVVLPKLQPVVVRAHKRPKPAIVKRWVNFSDPGDLIAIPRPLSSAFDVDLELEPSIGLFDFHRVDRYLAHPATAAVVSAALAAESA